MKIFFRISLLALLLFSERFYAQADYSLGIILGSGMNIYKNTLPEDKNRFSSNAPISLYLGARLSKNLDDKNSLFTELLFTRKKIEYRYELNESEIPFSNKETVGQKYDVFSLFVGYRRSFPINSGKLYAEAGIGAEYNNNVMSYNEGNGESQDGLNQALYFENTYNTNLGEKTYTASANIGFGFSFGYRYQYDVGIAMNIPIQKIQSKESTYQYLWNYGNKTYTHQLGYLGNIYYPSLRFSVLIF